MVERILVDGMVQSVDLCDYPKKYRMAEVFLDIVEKNPDKKVVHTVAMEIVGWREGTNQQCQFGFEIAKKAQSIREATE